MLFRVILAPLLVAVVAYAHSLRTEHTEHEHTHDGPFTLGAHTYASKEAFIRSGHRCGTKEIPEVTMFEVEQKLSTIPHELATTTGTTRMATVNVHFHVIQTSGGVGAVSDADIQAQMDVLNTAYDQVNAKFVFKGTNRVTNNAWFDMEMGSSEEYDMKSTLRVGNANVLNVYTLTNSEGILGWATFPSDYQGNKLMDGVVIDYRTLPNGSLDPYNEGATLVHEAGHWMGLYHTFQGGCKKYGDQGDRVKDTPCVKEPNFGCPDDSTNSCPGSTYQFAGNDMVHNYMDYTDDDCMDEFTKGQKQRMRQNWLAYRKGF